MEFDIISRDGMATRQIGITDLVVAGWTGRDKAAMEHHISELEALGVPRPVTTPVYYRCSASRLTTAERIETTGGDSSGEVEFVLVASGGELFIGAGSDHTDRKVETYSVTVSKQMCEKPMTRGLWPVSEVANHWDRLILRSHATIGGERVLYQEGTVDRMLPFGELIAGYTGGGGLPDGTAMFGGTFAAIGGIRPAERFEGELEDLVLGRRLSFAYDVATLPVMG